MIAVEWSRVEVKHDWATNATHFSSQQIAVAMAGHRGCNRGHRDRYYSQGQKIEPSPYFLRSERRVRAFLYVLILFIDRSLSLPSPSYSPTAMRSVVARPVAARPTTVCSFSLSIFSFFLSSIFVLYFFHLLSLFYLLFLPFCLLIFSLMFFVFP